MIEQLTQIKHEILYKMYKKLGGEDSLEKFVNDAISNKGAIIKFEPDSEDSVVPYDYSIFDTRFNIGDFYCEVDQGDDTFGAIFDFEFLDTNIKPRIISLPYILLKECDFSYVIPMTLSYKITDKLINLLTDAADVIIRMEGSVYNHYTVGDEERENFNPFKSNNFGNDHLKMVFGDMLYSYCLGVLRTDMSIVPTDLINITFLENLYNKFSRSFYYDYLDKTANTLIDKHDILFKIVDFQDSDNMIIKPLYPECMDFSENMSIHVINGDVINIFNNVPQTPYINII